MGNVDTCLKLAHHLKHWAKISPALSQCLVMAWCWLHINWITQWLMSGWLKQINGFCRSAKIWAKSENRGLRKLVMLSSGDFEDCDVALERDQRSQSIWYNAVSMVGQRLLRLPTIESASGERPILLALLGSSVHVIIFNLTSLNVRLWRLKSIHALKELKYV